MCSARSPTNHNPTTTAVKTEKQKPHLRKTQVVDSYVLNTECTSWRPESVRYLVRGNYRNHCHLPWRETHKFLVDTKRLSLRMRKAAMSQGVNQGTEKPRAFHLLNLVWRDRYKLNDLEFCNEVRNNPEFVRQKHKFRAWGGYEIYPIFYALFIEASPMVIKLLVDLFPESLLARDRQSGWTPLHIACMSSWCKSVTNSKILQLLVTREPIALEIVDVDGYTPLHTACASGASLKEVQILGENYPSALDQKVEGGNTPLHLACASYGRATVKVVDYLVGKEPKAIGMVNNNGKTPLMTAEDESRSALKNQALRKEGIGRLCNISCVELYLKKLSPAFDPKTSEEKLLGDVRYFESSGFAGGVLAVLDARPSFVCGIPKERVVAMLNKCAYRGWTSAIIAIIKAKPGLIDELKLNGMEVAHTLAKVGNNEDLTAAFEVLRSNPHLMRLL